MSSGHWSVSSRPRARRAARFAGALALAGCLAGQAPDARALFIVNQPWVKPGAKDTEAYMLLTSTDGATLVGVRSALAARASMRSVRGGERSAVTLPAGVTVALRPNADRIVLRGLARTLKPGDRFPLTLQIQTADGTRQDIAVDAEVRFESPLDAERRAHH
jgi:copper(I)-binding protein